MSNNPNAPLQAPGLHITAWSESPGSMLELLRRVPAELPALYLGGINSEWGLLALAWDECELADLTQKKVSACISPKGLGHELAYSVGTVVLQSYDAWAGSGSAPARAFRIRKALVGKVHVGQYWLCEEAEATQCHYQIPWPLPPLSESAGTSAIEWIPQTDDESYLQNVAKVISEIREGRYYQLNLLRYWKSSASPPRSYWLNRMRAAAGPFSAYLDMPDLGLVSCSPERFVQISNEDTGTWIRTEPIKGTRPVRADAKEDQKLRDELAQHPKDRAELNMIIDLMRNDLQKVSYPRSVSVLDPGTVHSFSHVHHLIAKIEARLREDICWRDLWAALCPGGSITGAPKIEVMKAIFEREQRPRAYFMGNIFYIDAYSGRCDSSILIRTAMRTPEGTWEYAAGSGLTVRSDPQAELEEVNAKARVILG